MKRFGRGVGAASAAVLALVVLGALAEAAVAQGEEHEEGTVTLYNEPESVNCGSLSIANHSLFTVGELCSVHFTSIEPFVLEVFGMVVSECDVEFDARMGGNGDGAVRGVRLTGPDCSVIPCHENLVAGPWPMSIYEFLGETWSELAVCVLHPLGELYCETDDIRVTDAFGHDHFVQTTEMTTCENEGLIHFSGAWESEADPGDRPEIIHN